MRVGILVLGCLLGACMTTTSASSRRNSPTAPYTNVYLKAPAGAIGQHYSARIGYRSNYIASPQYDLVGTLPPGVAFDRSTGVISGTPRQAGVWTVDVGVRDRNKGTHREPAGQTWFYFEHNVTIRVHARSVSGSSGYARNNNGGSFPQPVATARTGGARSIWEIHNQTLHSIRVSYRGAVSGSVTVGPGTLRTLHLTPGRYSVSASTTKPNVRPFSGSVNLNRGWKFRNRCYLQAASR